MRFFTPFRLAGYLAILFCAGHTFGGMLAQSSLGVAADEVFGAMKATHFRFNGADCTWYGFWLGFGLIVSIFLLLVAWAAFVLDGVSHAVWSQLAPLAWGLVVAMLFNGIVSWRYFFAGPTILSVLIAALLTLGAIRKRRLLASSSGSALGRA